MLDFEEFAAINHFDNMFCNIFAPAFIVYNLDDDNDKLHAGFSSKFLLQCSLLPDKTRINLISLTEEKISRS